MRTAALIILVVATEAAAQDPFSKLNYDSVVAYNFGLRGRYLPTILLKDSTLDRSTILPGRKLSSQETSQLLARLNNKRTYGGAPMACFEPKHAFIFYGGTGIKGMIEICFQCNNIRSTPDIPAVSDYFNKSGKTIQNYGFSERGVKWLKKFCAGLGMRER